MDKSDLEALPFLQQNATPWRCGCPSSSFHPHYTITGLINDARLNKSCCKTSMMVYKEFKLPLILKEPPKRSFNTQSKPSMCSTCFKFFHKINCLKDHLKVCSNRSSSGTGLPNPTLTMSSPGSTASSWPPEATSSTRSAPSLTIPGLQTSISFVSPSEPLPPASSQSQ